MNTDNASALAPGTREVLAGIGEWSKVSTHGVSLARLAGFDAEGRCLLVLREALPPVAALSVLQLGAADVGAQLVVAFEHGNVHRPVILGRVVQPSPATPEAPAERLVLQARERIELRCGDASIVLTQAGKVLIRGSYVLSRSRGANKIKGAFVDIN